MIEEIFISVFFNLTHIWCEVMVDSKDENSQGLNSARDTGKIVIRYVVI